MITTRLRLTFLFLSVCAAGIAAMPDPALSALFAARCPPGYQVLAIEFGNINADGIIDGIALYNDASEASTPDIRERRICLACVSDPVTGYREFKNQNMVPYYGFDGNFPDSFVDFRILDYRITVNLYGGFQERWGRTTVFLFDEKKSDLLLESDETEYFKASDPEFTERIVASEKKQIRFEDYSFYE